MTTTQNALVALGKGRYGLVDNATIPLLKPGTMLCRVRAVALNPADCKMVDFSASPGAVGGNDFAGEVIEIADDISRFKVGDRVLAMTFGNNPLDKTSGAFSNYAIATEDLSCKMPDWMDWEHGASMAVGIATAGFALHRSLGLPMVNGGGNGKNLVYVLVSGGATATGTVAIQLIKASGAIPIATCSPESNQLVRSVGAAEVFDYHSATCGAEIRVYTNNTLAHVLDCISEAATMKMCYEAIGSGGGSYIALDPFPTHIQYTRRDVRAESLMILALFGGEVALDGVYGRPADQTNRLFARDMFPLAERLIGQGLLVPHPIEVRLGGLERVVDGIEDLRRGVVKARKLVYPV